MCEEKNKIERMKKKREINLETKPTNIERVN